MAGSRCVTQGAQAGALWGPRGMGCGGREAAEGGATYVTVADLHCCTAENQLSIAKQFSTN